jgi:hypothetical protein
LNPLDIGRPSKIVEVVCLPTPLASGFAGLAALWGAVAKLLLFDVPVIGDEIDLAMQALPFFDMRHAHGTSMGQHHEPNALREEKDFEEKPGRRSFKLNRLEENRKASRANKFRRP